MTMNLIGTGKRLADEDLPYAGSLIGVGEDEIHAVLDVETRGSGFDSKNRLRILFEPHVFYRNLSGAKRDQAVKAGLAYPKWGEKPYPKDSYPRLEKAIAIDETAALKATSWALGQILGENYKAAGFASPQAMVSDFLKGEREQLLGMVNFIKANKLDEPLRKHQWAIFARGYNGAGYAKNQYDKKLDAAYKKWAKIPDTPYQPAVIPVEPVVDPALDKDTILRVQTLLAEKGYPEVGQYDGLMGKRTRNAILAFQADNSLPLTGEVTDDLLAALIKAPKREIDKARATATATDLKDRTIVQKTDVLTKAGTVLAGLGIGLGGINSLEALNDRLTALQKVYTTVLSFGPWALVAVAGGVALYYGRQIRQRYVEQHREGKAL